LGEATARAVVKVPLTLRLRTRVSWEGRERSGVSRVRWIRGRGGIGLSVGMKLTCEEGEWEREWEREKGGW
jgi:hypothetical protein